MPEKYKIQYDKNNKINKWSIRNQLKIAIQEAVDELPVRDDIPVFNRKKKNSNNNHLGFKSRYIL